MSGPKRKFLTKNRSVKPPAAVWTAFVALFAAAFFVTAATASAGEVEIEVSVDKAEITVGDPVLYSIALTWDPKIHVNDPVLEENLGALVVRDRKSGQQETLPDGRKKKTDVYTITSYQVGEYKIPPPIVRYNAEGGETFTAVAEPVALKVRSIAPEDAKEIRDIKPPKSVPRDLRQPILIGIGVLALLIAAVVLIVYFVRRSRRKVAEVPVEPPYDRAMRRFLAVRNAPRADHEEMKAFYVELSDLLRDYLDGRFRVPAPLLTTRQLELFIEEQSSAELAGKTDFIGVLKTADFVKFAKYDPSEVTVASDLRIAEKFLSDTKPPETEPKKPATETPDVPQDAPAEGGAP